MICTHLDNLEAKIQTLNRSNEDTLSVLTNLQCKKCKIGAPLVFNCLGNEPNSTCSTQVCFDHIERHSIKKGHYFYFNISQLTTFCNLCKQSDVNCVYSFRMFGKIAESIGYNDKKTRNKKLTGLKNLGSTCYLNTAVQCLCRILPLQTYLRKDPNLKYILDESQEHELTYQMREILKLFWRGHILISPNKFVNQSYSLSPDYKPKAQQDSQEFMRYLIDEMDRYLEMKTGSKSIINKSMRGKITCVIKCNNCSYLHTREDEIGEISLAVPENQEISKLAEQSERLLNEYDKEWQIIQNGTVWNKFKGMMNYGNSKNLNLYDCLISYFTPQILDSDGNLYHCDKCDGKYISTQSYKIKEFPDVLIINLKRFKYSRWGGSKISTQITMPFELNLDNFASNPSPLYHISSIIQHSGFMFKGHYIAYCKDFETDRWFEYDDKKVRQVPEEKVRNAQAYVAIYTRFPIKRQKIISKGQDVFIPKEWLYRYYSLSTPGPINFNKYYCNHSFLKDDIKEYDLLGFSSEQWNDFKTQISYEGEPIRFKNACFQCLEFKHLLAERINFEKQLRDITKACSKEYPCFFISMRWIKKWHKFLDSVENHSNSPGIIQNEDLFKLESVLKEGLIENIDFIQVNEDNWILLKELYDCDIPIIKHCADIYSDEVNDYKLAEVNSEISDMLFRFRRLEKN